MKWIKCTCNLRQYSGSGTVAGKRIRGLSDLSGLRYFSTFGIRYNLSMVSVTEVRHHLSLVQTVSVK